MNKKNSRSKAAIKYAVITAIGFMLFVIAGKSACPQRVNNSVGGEFLLLFLPLIWWLAERTIKDYAAEQKKLWQEAQAERAAEKERSANE